MEYPQPLFSRMLNVFTEKTEELDADENFPQWLEYDDSFLARGKGRGLKSIKRIDENDFKFLLEAKEIIQSKRNKNEHWGNFEEWLSPDLYQKILPYLFDFFTYKYPSEVYDPKLNTPATFSYLWAVKYWDNIGQSEDDPVMIRIAQSQFWGMYCEYRFGRAIREFFKSYFSSYQITLNFVLYYFAKDRALSVVKWDFGTKDNEISLRNKAFAELRRTRKYFTFQWPVVEHNNVRILYFDKHETELMQMDIYEIDPDVEENVGCNHARYFGKCSIENKNRLFSLMRNPKAIENALNNLETIKETVLIELSSENKTEEVLEKIKAGLSVPSLVITLLKHLFQKAARNRKTDRKQFEIQYNEQIQEIRTYIEELKSLGIWNKLNSTWAKRDPDAFEKEDVSVFKDYRDNNKLEKEYQYSVIRFLIRTKIFNPKRAEWPFPGSSELDFKNLLKNAPSSIVQTLEEQFNSTHLFKGFEHEKTNNSSTKWGWKYTPEDNEKLDELIHFIDENHPEFIDVRLATFEAGFFLLTQEDNSISHIYWIPIVTNWRGRKTGGVNFINTDKRIGQSPDENITPESEVPQDLLSILNEINGLVSYKQIEEIIEDAEKPSINAAAISIMSRNISHNLGSHLLSYIKNILSDEIKMLDHGAFENLLIKDASGNWKSNDEIFINGNLRKENLLTPYMRSIGHLLAYLQERQDYVGAIAAGAGRGVTYFTPVHFRDAIYQHFCKPFPAMAVNHTKKALSPNLLLDFLVYSEGYTRKGVSSSIDKREYQKKEIEIEFKAPKIGENVLEVSLPMGLSGRQGIFTILENFIRNSAKHGKNKQERGGKINIHLQISDFNEEYFEAKLWDGSNEISPDKLSSIQEALEKPLIKDDGTVDEGHKGVKEMQIAAGWLRGIAPGDLLESRNLPILTANASGKGYLTYSFYLKKPQKVLLIISKNQERFFLTKREIELLRHAYWDIVREENFTNKQPGYRFILIQNQIKDEKIINAIQNHFGSRIIKNWPFDLDELKKGLKKKNLVDLEDTIYIEWLDEADAPEKSRRFSLLTPPAGYSEYSKLEINIWDDIKPTKTKKPKQNDPLIRFSTYKNELKGSIWFGKHLNSIDEFKSLYEEKVIDKQEEILFIEGITGNNSTSRLVREEIHDRMWSRKIQESALTKVLIIDERIWKGYWQNVDREWHDKLLKCKNIEILSLEEASTLQIDFGISKKIKKDCLHLVNLTGKVVAYITRSGRVEWVEPKQSFHFVSLHQGLLDRMVNMYEGAGLDQRDRLGRLFDEFKKGFPAFFRHIIHSGRSKNPDLPTDTAFLPLSALDAAFSDCKFTLTELLYSTTPITPVK